jgi:ATP-binding cassette subfamily A (ABC1) protein 5
LRPWCRVFNFKLLLSGVGAGETQIDGVVNQTNERPVTGLGFSTIETNPNRWQTLVALLRLRMLRMFRDIQKLYFMIILPLGFAAGGLYIHSIQSTDPKMKSLILNGGDKIPLIFISNTII